MTVVAIALVALPFALFGYAYVGYPILLAVAGRLRPRPKRPGDPAAWPVVSFSIPMYNEARVAAEMLESILAVDYPADRRQVLVISDASDDGTDDIVRQFAGRGVELLRQPQRRGKSAGENLAAPHLRGEIVINTDASVRIRPDAVKELVRWFQDPTVGVASGRDVSVSRTATDENRGEAGYVGYEMWVRQLETRLGTIVGASGCLYAIRRELVAHAFPEDLSRDFASCLIAREHGFRAVSVDEAVCFVPRAKSLSSEYRRKVRTMVRGLQTLWYKRALLDPLRFGRFACFLASHKLVRWLVFLTLPLSLFGLALLAIESAVARWLLLAALLGLAVGLVGIRWESGRGAPRPLRLLAFAVASCVAGLVAWLKAFAGHRAAIWEPTRRTP